MPIDRIHQPHIQTRAEHAFEEVALHSGTTTDLGTGSAVNLSGYVCAWLVVGVSDIASNSRLTLEMQYLAGSKWVRMPDTKVEYSAATTSPQAIAIDLPPSAQARIAWTLSGDAPSATWSASLHLSS